MRDFVKAAAITCKVLAIIFWLCTAWFVLSFDARDMRATSPPHYRDAPLDWGTPAYFHRTYLRIGESALLTLLALAPNRLLVSSRAVFTISLAAALIPLRIVFTAKLSFHGGGEMLLSVFILAFTVACFAPLPVSIILSFLRHRKGETVTYA